MGADDRILLISMFNHFRGHLLDDQQHMSGVSQGEKRSGISEGTQDKRKFNPRIHLEYAADLQTSPTEGCIQQSIGRKAVDRAGCIIFKESVSASKNTNRILTRRVMRSGDKAFWIIAR